MGEGGANNAEKEEAAAAAGDGKKQLVISSIDDIPTQQEQMEQEEREERKKQEMLGMRREGYAEVRGGLISPVSASSTCNVWQNTAVRVRRSAGGKLKLPRSLLRSAD